MTAHATQTVLFNKPKSIVKTVAEFLRESIVAGDLKPGQKISSTKITKKLEVSSIPIREAFRILEGEGLIISQPGRGSWVSKVSRKDLEDSFEMRVDLELFGVDLLKKLIEKKPETVEELKKIDIREQSANFGPESCLIFHRQLIELTENKRLLDLYDICLTFTRRYQRMTYTIRHGGDSCVEPHSAILKPLIEGNYEDAKKAIRYHLEDGLKRIKENVHLSK